MANIGKFDGNVNNRFLFGKKEVQEQPKQAETKETVPVAGAKVENKDINLNQDPNAIYSTMGLNLSKTSVDKEIAKYLDAKTLAYVQNTPEAVAKRISAGVINTYAALADVDGNDPLADRLASLPAKHQPTAEQRERISNSVTKFESYFA